MGLIIFWIGKLLRWLICKVGKGKCGVRNWSYKEDFNLCCGYEGNLIVYVDVVIIFCLESENKKFGKVGLWNVSVF